MRVRVLLSFLLLTTVGVISVEAKGGDAVKAWGTVFADGKPISDAKVVACDADTAVIAHNYRTKIAETISDAKGRFAFDNLNRKKGTVYSLIAYAPGYAIGWYSHSNSKKLQDVKIHLGKPTQHRGVVKDKQKNPIEGAKVQIVILTEEFGKWKNRISLGQEIGYGFAQTDADGHFSIPHLPKGSGVYLLIDHPDYARFSHSTFISVGEQMTFYIPKGENLQGKIYFETTGESPNSLTVLARPDIRIHDSHKPRHQVQTDEEGYFVFSHILPGSYYLLLPQSIPGWTYVAPYVKVEEGKGISGADIVLTEGVDIHGEVLYEEKPLADAEVRIFHASQPPYTQGVEPNVVYTDENGRYQAQSAPGKVDLLVTGPKGYTHLRALSLKEGEVLDGIDFELSKVPLVTIGGKVQKPDGTPASNATVIVTPIQMTQKTNKNGMFSFDIAQGDRVVFKVSLSKPPMKRVLPITAIDDTQVTITLMPGDDKLTQKTVLTQELLKVAQKYRDILRRRQQLSLGRREYYPEVDPARYPNRENHQYFQTRADVGDILGDYVKLTDDFDAFNPGGWINQAFSGMAKLSASAETRRIRIRFTNEIIRQ